RAEAEKKVHLLEEQQQADLARLGAEEQQKWSVLQQHWQAETRAVYEGAGAMNATAATRFPVWSQQMEEQWTPPVQFSPDTPFAHLEVDLARHAEALPKDPRLALPGPPQLSFPLALSFPQEGSLLFESRAAGDPPVIATLNNIILRLLSSTPPGKLSFTIIDPVGLGQNFAGLMHLADYEESLINRRIWTQRDQIEERLAELNEHIEKVIQMYLRNEYESITEYNEQAGSVAEKYHLLVVADFPSNFSDVAAKRLMSIAASGAKCGVYTLIHWDQRQPLPDGFVPEDLRKAGISIRHEPQGFIISPVQAETGAVLIFDPPPPDELAVSLIHKIGKSSIDSNRVEVPFSQIAPKPDELWMNDTTNELRIAIGRTGATKLQYLAIGKGTRQHALFAGKTGSGKSTLFHVIITNLALSCSPDQVEFYLIDFKKGVEFKCYASKKLPHARVIAIESDREFGLSVLQRVDDELKRRGDMFRKLGVQDIPGYKRAGGTEPMPRTLLLIDEFQEFFVDDDAVAQSASLLFDRIVRQGRAFGIHVLLGSQTLGGAYSLARATIGQMVIRVALQCNEADAYLIMDDNNPAPRLLSRPGEGIYNDAAGTLEGNSPFQVVWMTDDERDDWLDKIHDLAVQRHDRHASPIVFEGNAPADLDENDLLAALFRQKPVSAPLIARSWLGAPNSIKGPTEAAFSRQSGSHLLIVGQREEASLTMIGLSMLALSAQYPAGGAKFVLVHGSAPGSADAEFLDQIVAIMPHKVTVSRGQDIAEVINEVAGELKARSAGDGQGPAIFLLIHGLHKFKKLRQEDDFSFSMSDDTAASAAAQFIEIITEGSTQGIHVITTVDTYNNVNRSLSRKALSEF
ncbi:MAG: segregation ATPase, FtsK/SpoIIIE family, partial [Verrucomicrobiaceae bacterium]|nr:segregation ATPase, FtsK/SpoIIIE family [Verrucomicrobiaceae bacterium]